MTDITLPKVSMNMTDGVVVEWYVGDGDDVEAGEAVVEFESEKATQVIEAPASGTISIAVEEGDRVPVGEILATITGEGDADESSEEPANGDAPRHVAAAPSVRRLARETGVDLETVEGSGPSGRVTETDVRAAADGDDGDTPTAGGPMATTRVRASPAARQLARDRGIELASVDGSGPDAAVVRRDVEHATIEPGEEGLTVVERRPLSSVRETIATRLTDSWREKPHVTVDRDVDVTRALALVDELEAEVGDVSLSDLLIAAVSETLGDHPGFNARFTDGEHVLYEERNVAIAVDAPRGLVAPVIQGTDTMGIEAIAAARRSLGDAARSGSLGPDRLTGGTFTVSNLGPLGVRSFTPIINPPQVAILGVGAVRTELELVDGEPEERAAMTLSLSFDHRVVDGADAARFLATLDDHLDTPLAVLV